MGDPNKIWAPGDELSLGARQLNMWTRGAQLAHQALGGGTAGLPIATPATLSIVVRNDHDTLVPPGGLTRWYGPPLAAASTDSQPQLVLRTSIDTTHPIGVAAQVLRAADAEADPVVPAGIGLLQILGVCWARCRGEIVAGDTLTPDEEFYGVAGGEGASNVIALADMESYGEAILPVYVQSPPAVCGFYWQFSAEGLPAGGESEWDVEYNGVTERITFPCPCTVAQTRAALETHSEIAPEELISITGGTLPTTSQKVLFRQQPGDISLAVNSLERSWTAPPSYYWDPL